MFDELGVQGAIGRRARLGDETGRWTDVKAYRGESEGRKSWGSVPGLPFVEERQVSVIRYGVRVMLRSQCLEGWR